MMREAGAVKIMAEQCTAQGGRGVVAAAAPVAARLGASVLENGGNAYDAVVVAALAETVLLPPKCGLSGDMVALSWTAGSLEPEALLAIGGAPGGLAAATARGELHATGPTSVGVPGAPAGYVRLAERARFAMPDLAAPAIRLATEGFSWSKICTLLTHESQDLLNVHNPNGTVYLPEGAPIVPGATVRLPGLARALEAFGNDPSGFLQGPVGEAIVLRVQEAGGVLAQADMAFSTGEWAAVASVDGPLGRYFATPAPTHGPSLLDVVSALGSAQPPYQADVYRSVMDAVRQRQLSLSDPSGTSMVSAVDRNGEMVTVVHSNSFPRFGSGLVVSEYDLILANRAGRGFSTVEGHPNFPTPGRRPATTLHAWAVSAVDGRRIQGATPGGSNQMPWNAQALARLQQHPTEVAEAVVDSRWEWLLDDDGVRVEHGMPESELDGLRAVAPRVETVDRWGLRSAMQIVVSDAAGESALAVVDPRTGGGVCSL